MVYNDISTSDPDEIVNVKHSLKENYDYEVSLDYDSNGFVNKVTLTEIGSSFGVTDAIESDILSNF